LLTTKKQKNISELIEQKLADLTLPMRPSSLYEPVRYMMSLGGKRVRFYFTLIGCGLCDEDIEEALPAATAIELLHNFTLLHDDIMDSAETRRGRPSVFKKWDSSTAILSGDAMYAWAFEQLQYYGRNERYTKQQYSRIIAIFLEVAQTVCEGQAYDLEFEKDSSVTLNDYLEMIQGKTVALISSAFRMGAVIAGASSEHEQKLEQIGHDVGVAFQIQDDILDVVADPSKFGKKMGGDISEGKKTYLYLLSLKRANRDQKEELHNIFGKPDISAGEVQKVIDLYQKLQVIEAAEQIINEHYDQAINQTVLFDNNPYKTDLKTYLSNLKNREY
jgi:geranylgeranyl diphosphate synthase type II